MQNECLLLIASVAFVVMITIFNVHLRNFFGHELQACALIFNNTRSFECSDIMWYLGIIKLYDILHKTRTR